MLRLSGVSFILQHAIAVQSCNPGPGHDIMSTSAASGCCTDHIADDLLSNVIQLRRLHLNGQAIQIALEEVLGGRIHHLGLDASRVGCPAFPIMRAVSLSNFL